MGDCHCRRRLENGLVCSCADAAKSRGGPLRIAARTYHAGEALGAPARRAVVNSAQWTLNSGAAGGAFCKVLGSIERVHPRAPDINFEVNLPTAWNEKAIQYGGGGYDGSLVDALDNVPLGADNAPTP